jgi:hypothetical protein
MARDPRTYITLHDGMPENKKVKPLGDKSFRTLIELWCWCSRNGTDGNVDSDMFLTFGNARARDQLLDKGLVERAGQDYIVHDYLEHQRSQDEIRELREKRSKAGAMGGRPKANSKASAKQVLSKSEAKITHSHSHSHSQQNTDLTIHPHLSSSEAEEESDSYPQASPLVESVVTAVAEFTGLTIHSLAAADVIEFFDGRRPRNATPPKVPTRYYAGAIARTVPELTQFLHENGLAS